MKWFQHDVDALTDRKLMDLAAKHGAEGIGIYWTVVEKIAAKMGTSVTLELEEESYHLAQAFWGKTPIDKIDVVIKACEDLGLFDRGPNNRIRCLTLLKKLDTFTKSNPQIRAMKEEMERFKRDYPRNFKVTSKSLVPPTKIDTNQESFTLESEESLKPQYPSVDEIWEKARKDKMA